MTVANPRTLRDVELSKVLERVASMAGSSLGAEAVQALTPSADFAWVTEELATVEEMLSAVRDGFSPGGLHNLRPLLEEAHNRGSIAPEALLSVTETLEAAVRVRDAFAQDTPRLLSLVEDLSDQEQLVTAIRRAIDDRGNIREDATPKLRQLHHQRRQLTDGIQTSLRSFIDRHRDWLQEPVVTHRGGRLVVPLKAGLASQAQVVIHDSSASGQTLFVEPSAVVQLNNRLREVGDAIWREERRILAELTGKLLVEEPRIRGDLLCLGRVDGLFARAKYAIHTRAEIPKLSRDGRVELHEARHPLLGDRAVPISISFGGERRMALITGPNTGGKTVSLKTVGLLTLMAQCGIPVPASPRTCLTVFGKVRSDIGEEQSIEQDLSTFSSHMTNIIALLGDTDEDTLVLLDELGAGTDPQEGAALGLAILERLLEINCPAAVATHLTPLKHFAISHPEIVSCSMEFDLESLSPTYRVLDGVPGRSCALIIARRLGLPEELVERAQARLSTGEIQADGIIEELQRERSAARRTRADLESQRDRHAKLRGEYERRLASLKERKTEALGGELARLEGHIAATRQELGELIAQARAEQDTEARRQALHSLEKIAEALPELPEERAPRHHAAREGDTVRIRSTGALGVVRRADDRRVEVEVKGRRVELPREAVEPAEGPLPQSSAPPRYAGRADAPLELSVRGMTVAEATMAVEEWLDRLLLSGIRFGRLVHGKGTGALRQGLHQYLHRAPHVRRFFHAPPAEGGEGVTIIEL